MAPTPPNSEPQSLVIGESWQWNRTHSPAPPSEGYTLSYEFHGPSSVAVITAATSSSGDYYEVREDKAANLGLNPGTYVIVGYVEKGTDRFEIYRSEIHLAADWTNAGTVDELTHDEKVLGQLNAAIEALTLNPHAETQVNGRRVQFNELHALTKSQGVYRSRVAMARRQGRFAKRKVSFVAPS